MGTVEDAVRREIEGNSALAELAYKLAREIDLDSGGVAAVRELRALLRAYKDDRGPILPYSPPRYKVDVEEREEYISNGKYFRNGEWVRRIGEEWVPVEKVS